MKKAKVIKMDKYTKGNKVYYGEIEFFTGIMRFIPAAILKYIAGNKRCFNMTATEYAEYAEYNNMKIVKKVTV